MEYRTEVLRKFRTKLTKIYRACFGGFATDVDKTKIYRALHCRRWFLCATHFHTAPAVQPPDPWPQATATAEFAGAGEHPSGTTRPHPSHPARARGNSRAAGRRPLMPHGLPRGPSGGGYRLGFGGRSVARGGATRAVYF
jgi:hypothetical protein